MNYYQLAEECFQKQDYEKASKQGYEEAIANMGYCYLYEKGVNKNKDKARELLLSCRLDYLYIPDELYEDDEDEEWF